MRVRVRQDAARLYTKRCYRGMRADCGMMHRPEWSAMLRSIAGQWVEVETDNLFDDQFNTVPIPGVSESGMRLMLADIDAIEDDARIGVTKCDWCSGYDRDHDGQCDKCGKAEYLRPLNPLTPR